VTAKPAYAHFSFLPRFLMRHRGVGAWVTGGILATLVADTAVLVLVAFTLKHALASLTPDGPVTAVWPIALECIALVLAKLTIDLVQAGLIARTVTQTMQQLRVSMFTHLQALPGSAFRETHFGVDATGLFTSNAQVIGDFLTHSAPRFAQNALLGLCSVAVMAALDWRLTLICVAALLLTLPIPRLLSARLSRALRERNDGDARSLALVDDAIAMHSAMRAFNLAYPWLTRFRAALADAAGPQGRAIEAQRLYEGSMVNLANLLVFVLVVATIALSGRHVIAIDMMGAFFVLLQYVAGALSQFGQLLARTTRAARAAQLIEDFLTRPRAPPPGQDSPLGATFDKSLDFDQVSFAYDAGHAVLDKLSFAVKPGESVALVGPSGSGKSSVLALLMREHSAQQGHVRLDGRDVADIHQADFSRLASIISQDTRLFNLTVRENIRAGKLDATDAEVEDAARLAEAHAMIMALPRAYDTPVMQYGANLSGGQRQRIAIARALVARPRLLLVDEATSALDAVAEAAINESLARIASTCTVIQVTHRLSAAALAGRILVMDGGRIVESGTHFGLLAQGGVYARLFEKQHAIAFDGNRPRVDTGLLRKVRLFAGVGDAVLAEMARCMMVERVQKNTVLFTEGSEGDKFYIVARGQLEVQRENKMLAFLDDGDCFGEIALLSKAPRNGTVVTRTECLLLTLDRHQFRSIVGQDSFLREQLGALVAQRSLSATSTLDKT
jgi:ATP-binding cassette subfamily B protein